MHITRTQLKVWLVGSVLGFAFFLVGVGIFLSTRGPQFQVEGNIGYGLFFALILFGFIVAGIQDFRHLRYLRKARQRSK